MKNEKNQSNNEANKNVISALAVPEKRRGKSPLLWQVAIGVWVHKFATLAEAEMYAKIRAGASA